MSVAENVAWIVASEGLVLLLKRVSRGDFLACRDPPMGGGVTDSLELLSTQGLVKFDSVGVRPTELGWFVLESLEALDWLPEIG